MTKLRGWYYDKQLDSPLTSATLHSNLWWDGKTFINWDKISGDNGFGNNGNKCDLDHYETILGAAKGACGYGMDPICTSILNEDFSVAISNTWSEFGGDPIGQAWNDLRGPLSGVTKVARDAIHMLFERNKEVREKVTRGEMELGVVAEGMSKFIDNTGEKVIKFKNGKEVDVVSFLNKALITNGTRFSYYGGTGIGFGNLSMKFTVFPIWKNRQFIEVPKQIEKLYPYFIGQIESFKDATGIGPDPDGTISPGGVAKEAANTCFLFQKPPGGYETEMRDVDIIQKGTLKLKIGNFYEIANLVCSDIMLNYSKNMVKNPITKEVSPLFCDVNITLKPSTKFSDKSLRKFVGGSAAARRSMQKIINDNLNNEKDSIRTAVNKIDYLIDQDYV